MNMRHRRQSNNVEDRRLKDHSSAAPQDNTFVRNEGIDPIRDIVKRNNEHNERLSTERSKKETERANYEPLAPTYEPIPDTKESLGRIARPDVFTRGRYRKSYSDLPPYKRNNNK